MKGLSKTFSGALLATTMFVAPATQAEQSGVTTASYAPTTTQKGTITDYTGEKLSVKERKELSHNCSFLESTGNMRSLAQAKAEYIATKKGRDVCLRHTENNRNFDAIKLRMDGSIVGTFFTQAEATAVATCEEVVSRGVDDPKAECDEIKKDTIDPGSLLVRNQL